MKHMHCLAPSSFVVMGLLLTILPLSAGAQGADDPVATSGRASDNLGLSTLNLLALQVSGKAAGPGSSIPGDQETASYKRYLDSFSKPIPDFFTNTIKSSSGS